MLKLWGRNNSVNVQKAIWCLEELKVPYERFDAGMQYGVVDTPEFRKMNPNGLVPVIEDGATVLWESNAIVRYLAAKYGKGTLWPKTRRRARNRTSGWTGARPCTGRRCARYFGGWCGRRLRSATCRTSKPRASRQAKS